MMPVIGMSAISRLVYEQTDPTDMWNALMARLDVNPGDAAALMDLSTLLQATGQRTQGLDIQSVAIAEQKIFRKVHGTGDALRVIAFVTAGDMMANTPIDFLLEGSDYTLFYVYVDATTQKLPDLPRCDVAILAIGESAETRPVLATMKNLLLDWQGPSVLNAKPETIAAMTRDGVNALFASEPSIVAPVVQRAVRHDMAANAYPCIIRPQGTHAGLGMAKIDDAAALNAYLEQQTADAFYLSPYIDYSSADGLFRKQRIVFINGKAFPSHYAVSEHWMVHYLSADMSGKAERRVEEAVWMQTFDTDFAVRHAAAFEALYRNIGLDYFGIDCAELHDGRLLLFEADVAMIVHDMDSADIFPYKKPAMQKLFRAFQTMLGDAASA